MERVLYARLSVSPSSSLGRRGEQINERQQEFVPVKIEYLLETFHRVDGELRKSSLAQFANESEIKEKFDLLMKEVKKLCISYGGLVLNPDEEIRGTREEPGMFPISEWEEQYGVNEFFVSIIHRRNEPNVFGRVLQKVLRGRPRSAGCNILA